MLTELSDGVGTITLNRPATRNAVDAAIAEALHECLLELSEADECRVIVVRGAGPAFCSGWDVKRLDALRDLPSRALERVLERSRAMLDDLGRVPQVTLAAVHGAALGFGLCLTACCDLAVAARGSRFGLPEVRHGIVPAFVMLDLARALPRKAALDWLLVGDLHDADAALAAGLVGRVVGGEALAPEVARIAAELAARPAGQLATTKHLFGQLHEGRRGSTETAAIRQSVFDITAAAGRE